MEDLLSVRQKRAIENNARRRAFEKRMQDGRNMSSGDLLYLKKYGPRRRLVRRLIDEEVDDYYNGDST